MAHLEKTNTRTPVHYDYDGQRTAEAETVHDWVETSENENSATENEQALTTTNNVNRNLSEKVVTHRGGQKNVTVTKNISSKMHHPMEHFAKGFGEGIGATGKGFGDVLSGGGNLIANSDKMVIAAFSVADKSLDLVNNITSPLQWKPEQMIEFTELIADKGDHLAKNITLMILAPAVGISVFYAVYLNILKPFLGI